MGALSHYTLPSTEEEVWRYSRVAELDLDAYSPADDSPVSGGIPGSIDAALATVPVRGVTIVTVNGRVVSLDVAAPGVDVVTEPEDARGIAMAEPTDVFAEMNDDFTTAPIVVRGATCRLCEVYLGEGDQMLDLRSLQDHAAPDTTSNLLFKGAVGGHSRSVYTGMIRVRQNARGTNAFQTNRNINLSDGAWG